MIRTLTKIPLQHGRDPRGVEWRGADYVFRVDETGQYLKARGWADAMDKTWDLYPRATLRTTNKEPGA
jgi:hypothetical protein